MLKNEYQYIKEEILALVESNFSGEITIEEFDGVSVKFDGKNAVIGCSTKPQFARGVFLLAKDFNGSASGLTSTEGLASFLPSTKCTLFATTSKAVRLLPLESWYFLV